MDSRTRREKLAAMAAQTASPREAEVAARLLAELPAPTTLTREQILSAPDLRAGVRARRVWDPRFHVPVLMDEDDPAFSDANLDWDGVE